MLKCVGEEIYIEISDDCEVNIVNKLRARCGDLESKLAQKSSEIVSWKKTHENPKEKVTAEVQTNDKRNMII